MRVIQIWTEFGADRMLMIQLPMDTPVGPVEVLVVMEPQPAPARPRTAEQRRAAARAGSGRLKHLGFSTEEFLAERREDEERRDKALGLWTNRPMG